MNPGILPFTPLFPSLRSTFFRFWRALLYVLDLSYNEFTGEISSEICNLNYVFLTNNQLCPPYPECVDDYLGYQDTSECVESQVGDINEDGLINVVDIVAIIDIILNTGEYNYLSDLNEDGLINVVDIVGLVSLILDTR